jgi:hypothetical protein
MAGAGSFLFTRPLTASFARRIGRNKREELGSRSGSVIADESDGRLKNIKPSVSLQRAKLKVGVTQAATTRRMTRKDQKHGRWSSIHCPDRMTKVRISERLGGREIGRRV